MERLNLRTTLGTALLLVLFLTSSMSHASPPARVLKDAKVITFLLEDHGRVLHKNYDVFMSALRQRLLADLRQRLSKAEKVPEIPPLGIGGPSTLAPGTVQIIVRFSAARQSDSCLSVAQATDLRRWSERSGPRGMELVSEYIPVDLAATVTCSVTQENLNEKMIGVVVEAVKQAFEQLE